MTSYICESHIWANKRWGISISPFCQFRLGETHSPHSCPIPAARMGPHFSPIFFRISTKGPKYGNLKEILRLWELKLQSGHVIPKPKRYPSSIEGAHEPDPPLEGGTFLFYPQMCLKIALTEKLFNLSSFLIPVQIKQESDRTRIQKLIFKNYNQEITMANHVVLYYSIIYYCVNRTRG